MIDADMIRNIPLHSTPDKSAEYAKIFGYLAGND
jgi:hypothetical protein